MGRVFVVLVLVVLVADPVLGAVHDSRRLSEELRSWEEPARKSAWLRQMVRNTVVQATRNHIAHARTQGRAGEQVLVQYMDDSQMKQTMTCGVIHSAFAVIFTAQLLRLLDLLVRLVGEVRNIDSSFMVAESATELRNESSRALLVVSVWMALKLYCAKTNGTECEVTRPAVHMLYLPILVVLFYGIALSAMKYIAAVRRLHGVPRLPQEAEGANSAAISFYGVNNQPHEVEQPKRVLGEDVKEDPDEKVPPDELTKPTKLETGTEGDDPTHENPSTDHSHESHVVGQTNEHDALEKQSYEERVARLESLVTERRKELREEGLGSVLFAHDMYPTIAAVAGALTMLADAGLCTIVK